LLGTQDAQLAAEIAVESSGSPFFVEQLSRQAQRSASSAPLRLHEAVLLQVSGLRPGARDLLEVLAVAGRPLRSELALEAAGATHEYLDALQTERLVRRSDGGQELEIECYHDRIRDSVLWALPAERHRALHASLLSALRARPDAEVERLAVHAQGAGDLEQAARYAAQAALRASESMAFDQAALLYARALELGRHSEAERRDLQTKLGEALANAGRGAEAAHAYLDAVLGATQDEALELKRRAAEQLLVSGLIDEGKALLDEVLRCVGLGLPRGITAALLALGWERLRLQLRPEGLAFRVRSDELPAARRRELDVLWTAARGLQAVDMFSGVALSSRYVRLALDSGSPDHAARALGSEAWFACTTDGAGAKTHAEALCARAEALAQPSVRPETVAWVQLMRGATALMHGEHQVCLDRCALAMETLRERCAGVAFELNAAQMFAQSAAISLGRFARAADLAALVDETARRGDALAATTLTATSAPARLLRGDADGVRRHIEQAKHHWPERSGYDWPHVHLLIAETCHAAYLGEDRRGLNRLRADWLSLDRGQFLRVPLLQTLLRAFRGSWALRLASRDDSDASALRSLARRDARALARVVCHPWIAHSRGRPIVEIERAAETPTA
jgi:hypothetical protein